ncbi:hypothetical protein PT974_00749 [Cladobotryum mycophilum]|uniref:Extracellular mutant protein 11 C-terminal domain-containing protein n=1 Tax=Cladobotryum mycophilum TaxID=491253 RepID=A0ABR0T2X9_9HYPO
MQSLKERSGRLQMFARLAAEAGGNTNAATQKTQEPEKRQDAPQLPASALERQELAELARLPIPKPIRQSLGHQRGTSQPPVESLRRRNSPSPVNHPNGMVADARRGDLFSGSQLGESFMMNSGITTPHNEPAELEPERAPTPDRRNNIIVPRGPPRNNFDRGFRPPDSAAFQIGDDLLMKVVTGARRHNPSHMNDGFHNGVSNGQNKKNGPYNMDYGRPASPAERQPKLPLREVKVRSVLPQRHSDYNARDKRPESPAFETNNWQRRHVEEPVRHTARFQEPDDDNTSTVNGDIHGTPKAKKGNMSPLRERAEIPMPPTALPLQPPRDKKRRRGTPDYDDMALSNMNYNELQSEPFDFDPSKATAHIGHGAGGGNLSAKLEQYRHQTDKEQRYLFRNLSVDDWEAAGDWFADQFAEIMHRLREARRNKRHVIQDFEDEAATREEAVRLRSEAIDRKLSKMRQDGQRVVSANEL